MLNACGAARRRSSWPGTSRAKWDGYVIGFFATLSELVALDKAMIGYGYMKFADPEIAATRGDETAEDDPAA